MSIIYILLVFALIFFVFYRMVKLRILTILSSQKKGINKTLEDFKIPFETIWFDSDDNVELCGWFVESQKESNSVFIICGDGFVNKSDLIEDTIHLKNEFNLFYVDVRGSGNSKGIYSYWKNEHRDIEASYRFLKEFKSDFSLNVFLYVYGFTALSLLNMSRDILFKAVFLKEPILDLDKGILKLLDSKIRLARFFRNIYKTYLGLDKNVVVSNIELKCPVVVISKRSLKLPWVSMNIHNEGDIVKSLKELKVIV